MVLEGGRSWGALALGLLPVASALAGLEIWAGFVLGLLASAGAGWLMPEAPVKAGALAFAPTAVIVGVAGLFLLSFAVLLPLVMGLMVSLVGSHFGAGMALRRDRAKG